MKNDEMKIGLDEIAAIHAGSGTLYHSLGHIIRSKIQSGELSVGQKIPSEREMMKLFGVSRATIRQGIDNLVMEGILYRIQGKGTFVSSAKIEQGVLRIMDFSDLVKQNGLKPSSQLLAKEKILPPPHVIQKLHLTKTEKAIWLQRLLSVNQIPILIETSYFSFKRFPDLLFKYDGEDDPHNFVYKQYGIKVARAKEIFEPVVLEDKEAAILGTQGGFPALWVEVNAYDEQKEPVEYLTTLIRGDRCRTYIDLVFEKD
jgi:GntR family transcriptional regulator